MRIALKLEPSRTYFVYGIYWASNPKSFQRYHYVIEPDDGVGGFSPLGADEVDVIDNSLSGYSLVTQMRGVVDIIAHDSTDFPGGLFDRLAENGYPEAVITLFQNMRAMGLEP